MGNTSLDSCIETESIDERLNAKSCKIQNLVCEGLFAPDLAGWLFKSILNCTYDGHLM